MAKENSFDIVSEVDLQEVDNAFGQTTKELAQRYDLKGSGASISFEKREGKLVVSAPSEFVARQVIDVLDSKLIKRGVDLKSVQWSDPVAATGSTVRLTGNIVCGIDQDKARSINKDIKGLNLKVKTQIEGEKLRVFSMSRDALQEVITFLKEQDYGVPLQYNNYR